MCGQRAPFPFQGAGRNAEDEGERAMVMSAEERAPHGTEHAVAQGIPEMRPWREVGWIFRDGDAFAIERSGGDTRARVTQISHLRDE